MDRTHCRVATQIGLTLLVLVLFLPSLLWGLPGDPATTLLQQAKLAFTEKNYPVAIERYKEFLAKHGGHKEAPAARFGLGLALLELPNKDHAAILEHFLAAANAEFPDRALAHYHLAVTQRELGKQALALSQVKSPETAKQKAAAQQRFELAAQQFGHALKAFAARPPADGNWQPRTRCDLAEVFLLLNKPKEAMQATRPMLAEGAADASYRDLATFYHGYALFLLKDYDGAGRTLSLLAPFEEPAYGLQVRFLLGRVHHLSDERPEAQAHYEAVLKQYEEEKKAAQPKLRDPNAFKDQPLERARLEALLKQPPPEHVARCLYYLGVVSQEEGRPAEAVTRLQTFIRQFPKEALLDEARLRLGTCLVQAQKHGEAVATLQPLEGHATLGEQALLWLARAQLGAVDVNNPQAVEQARQAAMQTLRKAADRAGQMVASDPDAKSRLGDALMEVADVQFQRKEYKEAAQIYRGVFDEKLAPERLEEALLRQAAALQLAGAFAEAEEVCQRFEQTYPKSPGLADVRFRQGENAFQRAQAMTKQPDQAAEARKWLDIAVHRYQVLIDKHPEHPNVPQARLGLGLTLHGQGQYDQAATALAGITAGDRTGPLAIVSYLHADCLLRNVPAEAEDALTAARAQEQLNEAAKQLEAFLSAAPKSEQAPDAMLKLGTCQHRAAAMLADPNERNKGLQQARQTFDRLLQQHRQHPVAAQGFFERANCIITQGDLGGGMNELRRFQNDPFKTTPVAPLAVVRLASLLREQNKPNEAADLLKNFREQQEATLLKDPTRGEHALLLRLNHGLALMEQGKRSEAVPLFDSLVREFGDRPAAAEGIWRLGQCRKEEALAKIVAASKELVKPGLKPEEITQQRIAIEVSAQELKGAAAYFLEHANRVAAQAKGSDLHLRLLYETAATHRAQATQEVETQRRQFQAEIAQRRQTQWTAIFPNQPMPQMPPPGVPVAAIAEQPAERQAREQFLALIALAPEAPLAAQSAIELAEMALERGDRVWAIKTLQDVLEKDLAQDVANALRLRLAACLLAEKDPQGASAQVAQVPATVKGRVAAEAKLRAAECLLQQAIAAKQTTRPAIEALKPFRDQPEFQNVAGITDLGLLRLAQGYAGLNEWEKSRNVYDILLQRFGQSPHASEARYGIGWAHQQLKQFDQAVNAYQQATQIPGEIAARAQVQMGLCRMEQKKFAEAANALLVVPLTYEYPELQALALCEAARAFVELKQNLSATKLLERVVQEHPESQWAELAKQRLTEIR